MKILVIAWAMPPLVYPRSIQISRLLRGLKENGIESDVICINPESDPFSMKDFELEDVYKDSYDLNYVEIREDIQRSSLFTRISRKLKGIEDHRDPNWIDRCLKIAETKIETKEYSVVISFAQPWVDHEIAYKLKRKFPNLPWIAHFSDPWVDSPYSSFETAKAKSKVADKERKVISLADLVLFTNSYTASLVMEKYPASWKDKVSVISHSYDRRILDRLNNKEPELKAKMNITYTGNFYGHRNPEVLFTALNQLKNIESADLDIVVGFVGHVEQKYIDLAKEMRVDDLVEFMGKKTYIESLEIASQSDLLLLMDAPAENNIFLPSKLVDYLMLGKPVLGLTPIKGVSADILRNNNMEVVPPDDLFAIKSSLLTCYDKWKEGATGRLVQQYKDTSNTFDVGNISKEFKGYIMHAINRVGIQ